MTTSQLIGAIIDLAERNESQSTYLSLLAISCLETTVEILPAIRQRVENLLASLIPPTNKDQSRRIAAAGNLAIPFLTAKSEYSAEEIAACAEILGMIGTRPALVKLGEYVKDKRRLVVNAISDVIKRLSPQEVFDSGLAAELKESLKDHIDGDSMSLNGTLLYILSVMETSELLPAFPQSLSQLRVIGCKPSNIYLIRKLLQIKSLTLSGNLSKVDIDSLSNMRLDLLDLRNRGISWINFGNSLFRTLKTLRLKSDPDDSNFEISWPGHWVRDMGFYKIEEKG